MHTRPFTALLYAALIRMCCCCCYRRGRRYLVCVCVCVCVCPAPKQRGLRAHKADIFSTKRHFMYGAPMTIVQLLVGVPILYAELRYTGLLPDTHRPDND